MAISIPGERTSSAVRESTVERYLLLRRAGGEVHVVDDKASVDKLVRQIHGGGR